MEGEGTVTEKLYYQDPGKLEFDAALVRSAALRDGRCEVVVDRTAFYPGGGGQPADRGTLGGAPVVEVREEDNGDIVHVLQRAVSGPRLSGAVDAARRRDFMAQHTGEHILAQALLQAGKLHTVSVHFGDEDTTIEVKADSIDDRVLQAAEDIANGVIRENRRLVVHEVDRSEAGRFPLRNAASILSGPFTVPFHASIRSEVAFSHASAASKSSPTRAKDLMVR